MKVTLIFADFHIAFPEMTLSAADQAVMALFGDVLESISVQEGNSFAENAALFAQASVAMADAPRNETDTSACFSATESLMPSPTKQTDRPSF